MAIKINRLLKAVEMRLLLLHMGAQDLDASNAMQKTLFCCCCVAVSGPDHMHCTYYAIAYDRYNQAYLDARLELVCGRLS